MADPLFRSACILPSSFSRGCQKSLTCWFLKPVLIAKTTTTVWLSGKICTVICKLCLKEALLTKSVACTIKTWQAFSFRFLRSGLELPCGSCFAECTTLASSLNSLEFWRTRTSQYDLTKTKSCNGSSKASFAEPGVKMFCIPMASFLEAVDCSFRFNMFRVGRHVFEQRMGSPMGSPISPSLCHCVVTDYEHRVLFQCSPQQCCGWQLFCWIALCCTLR